MKIIELDRVTVMIRGRKILHDVSLSIGAGELVALIGPNGAGKSTLMRVMSGLLSPTQGAVRLDGRPLATFSERERAKVVAYVSQNPQIGFGFSVEEIVAMGRYAHRRRFGQLTQADREAIEAAMHQTGVTELRKRKITEVSGGERQRVFLSRAVAQQPGVLLLDEPTANLDIRYQLELMSLIRDLNEKHRLTVVMAVHDLDLALRYCQVLVAINMGRVAAYGRPRDVITPEKIREVFGVSAHVIADSKSGEPIRVEYFVPSESPDPITSASSISPFIP